MECRHISTSKSTMSRSSCFVPACCRPDESAEDDEERITLHSSTSSHRTASKESKYHIKRGLFLQAQSDHRGSIDQYKAAVKLKPSAEAHFLLGCAYREMDNANAAIGAYRLALALDPKYFKARFELGIALLELKQDDLSIDSLLKANACKPRDTEVLNALGHAFKQRRLLDKAIKCYQRASSINPKDIAGHFNLGALYQGSHQLQKSLLEYKKVLDLRPKHGDTLFNIGYLYEEMVTDDSVVVSRKNLECLRLSYSFYCQVPPEDANFNDASERARLVLHRMQSYPEVL